MTYKLHTTLWRPSTPQFFHDIRWSQVVCNGPAFTCGHNSPITAGFPPAKTASTNTWTSPMSPADVKSSRVLPKTHAAVLSKEWKCSDWTHLGIWTKKRTKFKYSCLSPGRCWHVLFFASRSVFPRRAAMTTAWKHQRGFPANSFSRVPFSYQYCWGYGTVHSPPWSFTPCAFGSQTYLSDGAFMSHICNNQS